MADTIPAAKRAFLTSQVRILSAPLSEPADWRRGARLAGDEDELPERVVQDVLTKVNASIRRHNARAFPPAALAHIAAQIDTLYFSTAPAAQPGAAQHDEPRVLPDGTVQRGADLADSAVLQALPESWAEDSDEEEARSKRRRVSALESYSSGRDYAALRDRLLELDARRSDLKAQMEQVAKLRDLVRPLEQPAVSVQPNLVSAAGRGRTGELEAEMERMKRLIERVSERIDESR